LCAKSQKASIEDYGYGKGYVYLAEEFGKLLNRLEEIIELGVNVVFTAHAQMRKFEQPDEMGAYDRWEMKLQKKTAPLLKEWADAVLFVNYQTYVVNVDGQGTTKGKNKAQGGKRVMYTSHHPCWDAKNRFGLSPEVDFDYSVIAPFIPVKSGTVSTPNNTPQNQEQKEPVSQQKEISLPPIQHEKLKEIPQQQTQTKLQEHPVQQELIEEDLSDVPKALAALMKENQVTLQEIQDAVAYKEYYPVDTPFKNYDPGFVSGVLIAAWSQVYTIIELLRSKEISPF
ncbi:MAG: ATP-binding protein, partial [Ruminiclostridium sp.]